jgi:hypothetical protein
VDLPDLVLLANQNFIVLYLVCIYCFCKITRGRQRWALALPALVACCFLLAGFSYTIMYSIALFAIGMLCERTRKVDGAFTRAGDDL